MKTRTGIILCVITMGIIITACKKEAPDAVQVEKPLFIFTVQSVIGDVKIIKASGDKKAAAGDIIALSDTIITGSKSIADMTYGSSGIIRISENSKVAIEAIAGGPSSGSMLNLDRGRLFLTLGKLQNTGFKVRTPTIVVSVRGTSFIVSADVVRGARLAVMKGRVTVTPVKKGEAIEGKEISVGAGQKVDYLSPADVDRILSGGRAVAVKPMTEAEIKEVQGEAIDIRIDEIRGIDEEIRAEVTKDVIEADPKTLMKQAADASGGISSGTPVKKRDNTLNRRNPDAEKQAAEQRSLDDAKKKQEEELLKKAEEENQRARARKEKASNIPTL